MNNPSRLIDHHLEREQSLVLDWLRAPHRDPDFLVNAPSAKLASHHEAIARRFLDHIQTVGFHCQVLDISKGGRTAYETRWTHRGSSFVGFKQPPPEANPADALLAGCAALLKNEWCRARLPA